MQSLCYLLLLLLCLPLYTEQNAEQSYEWVDLTPDELRAWYTPADLCVLQSGEKGAFPQDIRAQNCTQFTRGSRRMFCGVGMGNNNYPCYGPFSARRSFKRGLRGFTDAAQTPLLNALRELQRRNASLVLAGDSTTRQKLQALHCEIARESQGRAKLQGNIFGIVPCDTELKITLPPDEKGGKGCSVSVFTVSLGPRSRECLTTRTYLFPESAHLAQAPEDVRHLGRVLHELRESRGLSSLLTVANMGLWYNEEEAFAQLVPQVLRFFQGVVDRGEGKVAWHETLSQHWIGADPAQHNGYYSKSIVDAQEKNWSYPLLSSALTSPDEFLSPHCCPALTTYSPERDWRNRIVRQGLREAKGVSLFPMAAMTVPLHDLHTCNIYYKHDCTHYCYTPLLFQLLWHQIETLSKEV